MRKANHKNRNSQNLFFLLFIATFLVLGSCSRRQIPVASKRYNPEQFTGEMQAFVRGGIERELKTGRIKPKRVIKSAEKYLGTPHCMGGTSSKCLDCSGLTYLAFTKNKIQIPRNSQEQARYGYLIFDRNDLKRGDLVFFTKSYKTSDFITHVGIYLGNGMFIHTSSSAGVTKTALSNSWWNERFVFGTRVF